jgi:hypothetical protein
MLLKFYDVETTYFGNINRYAGFELVYDLILLLQEHLKVRFKYKILNLQEWNYYSGYLVYEAGHLDFEASMSFIDKNKKENYIFRSYYEFPE